MTSDSIISFYIIPVEWCVCWRDVCSVVRFFVWSFVRSSIHPSVCPSRNVRHNRSKHEPDKYMISPWLALITIAQNSWNNTIMYGKKRLDLEASNFAFICMWTSNVCMPIFIQILDVLDRHFKGQLFESNKWASSYLKHVWNAHESL